MSCVSRFNPAQLLVPLVTLVFSSTTLSAQGTRPTAPPANAPRPTAAVLRAVDARLARNDSLGALAELDSALAKDRKNGPLWNRYGQIAWEMSKKEKGPVMRPDMVRLRIRADSAFRYAMSFSPDSAAYFRDMGLYALESNVLFVRQGAKGNYEDGLKVSRAQGRSDLTSSMTDGLGMFYWRDYDNNNHRATIKAVEVIADAGTTLGEGTYCGNRASIQPAQTVSQGEKSAAKVSADLVRPDPVRDNICRSQYGQYYRDRLAPIKPVTGESEYIHALQNFKEALAADPANAKARRHAYMAMAEKQAWPDLLRESENALRLDGDDLDAWMARALAESSLEQYEKAATTFDQAMRRMSAADRASFTDLRRLLSPSSDGTIKRFSDTLAWDSLPAAERRRQETLFWNLADPRSNTRVNEAMVEYFARIAYADIRFGSEEYFVRGRDSDRGRVWIRYGPPTDIYSLPTENAFTDIIWIYDRPQLAFVFNMRPSFGTASHAFNDISVDSVKTDNPVGWGNLPLARRTWPMRLRAARFRSSKDSMDVVVTATVPVRSFLQGAELGGALPVTVQLDVNDPSARIVGREIRKVDVKMDSLPVGLNGAWVRRLGRGPNVIRVDAEQVDVNRGASNTIDAPVDTTSGFGISDLLLGTNPKRVGNTDPKRWSDISIAPNTGAFPYSQSLGVIWEVYDLAPVDGTVKYKVNLHLQRTFAGNVGGFIAKIAAYSKNVIERNGSGTGSVAVSYDQSRPAASIIADYLSVNLDGSVTGTYRLTIEIEDLVSKKITRRTVNFDLTKD